MLSTGATKKKAVTNLYSTAFSIDDRKCQATDNKGDRAVRSQPPVLIHLSIENDPKNRDVRYF